MSMGLDAPGFGYPEPVSYSGLSMLLQYMEGSVVFNSLNYSILRGDPGNNTAMATSVSTFLCPSDPQQNLPPGQAGENYRPNSGNGIQYVSGKSDPWGFNTSLPPFNGVFYPVSTTRIAEITDGTSNTAAFCEMGLGDMSNAIATEKTDQFWTQTWPSTPDLAIADCQSFPPRIWPSRAFRPGACRGSRGAPRRCTTTSTYLTSVLASSRRAGS